MATNPRLPHRPQQVPTLAEQRSKKSASPLVPLGILVAAALLLAILIWLPRTPKQAMPPTNAAVPAQPTGSQIQLQNIRIVPDPTGGQMYIYATLFNAGSTAINGIRANVVMQDQNSQPLDGVTTTVENADGKSLVDNPIPPNAQRDVRMNVQQIPQGWNHQVPAIKVDGVTAQGTK